MRSLRASIKLCLCWMRLLPRMICNHSDFYWQTSCSLHGRKYYLRLCCTSITVPKVNAEMSNADLAPTVLPSTFILCNRETTDPSTRQDMKSMYRHRQQPFSRCCEATKSINKLTICNDRIKQHPFSPYGSWGIRNECIKVIFLQPVLPEISPDVFIRPSPFLVLSACLACTGQNEPGGGR